MARRPVGADLDSLLGALSLGGEGKTASKPRKADRPSRELEPSVCDSQAKEQPTDESLLAHATPASAAAADLDELLGSLTLSASSSPAEAAQTHGPTFAASESEAWSASDVDPHAVPEVVLRDYQRALLSSISRRFESGHTSVLAYLPTGGGKTHVAAAQVAAELNRGGRAIMVVNSRTLLEQTKRAFLRLGFGTEMVGVIGAGEEPKWRRPLQVAMIQSLHERFLASNASWMASFTMAVLDEAHAAFAATYGRLLLHLGPGPRGCESGGVVAAAERGGEEGGRETVADGTGGEQQNADGSETGCVGTLPAPVRVRASIKGVGAEGDGSSHRSEQGSEGRDEGARMRGGEAAGARGAEPTRVALCGEGCGGDDGAGVNADNASTSGDASPMLSDSSHGSDADSSPDHVGSLRSRERGGGASTTASAAAPRDASAHHSTPSTSTRSLHRGGGGRGTRPPAVPPAHPPSHRPSTCRVLGVTATPFRSSPVERLESIFSGAAFGPSVSELIERGVLVRPVVYGDRRPADGGDAGAGKPGGGGRRLCGSTTRVPFEAVASAALSKYERHACGLRCVAFCPRIDDSRALVATFSAAGVPAAHVDGSTPVHVRERVFEQMREGEILLLSNVDVLCEGFDLPEVEAVLLIRPTNSRRLYIQQVGRALRRAPGKRRCIILDAAGLTWRFGPVSGPPLSSGAGGQPLYAWEEACATAAAAGLILRRCGCGTILHASAGCPDCGGHATGGRAVAGGDGHGRGGAFETEWASRPPLHSLQAPPHGPAPRGTNKSASDQAAVARAFAAAAHGAVALGVTKVSLEPRGRDSRRLPARPGVGAPPDAAQQPSSRQGAAQQGAAEHAISAAAAPLADAAGADQVEESGEAWVGPVWHERRATHVWVHPTTGDIRLSPTA